MALLLFTAASLTKASISLTKASLAPTSSAPAAASTLSILFSFEKRPLGPHPKLFNGVHTRMPFAPKERDVVIVRASSFDGTGTHDLEPSSESDEESVPIEDLPLESKLQLKLEQKMKMKLDKRIRIRRKKLDRKRSLRKKGRWPPSKLDKNKNKMVIMDESEC